MLASGIVDLILADAGGACPEEIPDCVGLRQSRAGGAADRLSDVERSRPSPDVVRPSGKQNRHLDIAPCLEDAQRHIFTIAPN
jgi:hypothetical protein